MRERKFNDERIYYRLVNTHELQVLVDGVPSVTFADFGISKIFYMFLREDENGTIQSLLINDAVAKGFGYSLHELCELADANTHKLFPAKITPLRTMVKELQEKLQDDSFDIEKYVDDENGEAYMLTNYANIKGASCMFNKTFLDAFAKMHRETKLFILPVSEEEVLVYRASTVNNLKSLKEDMLGLAMYSKEQGEMLSDKVIEYDVKTRVFSVA